MINETDTIVAQATPPGRGGVGIVRVSGPACAAIAQALMGQTPVPRWAHYGRFLDADGDTLDLGLALFFLAPRSFTGEDVLELHGHGSPVVMDLLIARVCALGARPARPGEFSERAFLNDKIDLTQAEAIADLIEADSVAAARASLRSLQGVFSRRIGTLVDGLTALRMHVEGAIDFPEEEVDFLADATIRTRLEALRADLSTLRTEAGQGRLLREGLNIVIAGRPNVGKSSLLNRLAGVDAAIVTDIPGTTRDVLRERIDLDGLPLHIIDTAGLREARDTVEEEGIRRAWQEIGRADRLLLVIDDQVNEGRKEQGHVEQVLHLRLPVALPVTRVYNKIDLSGRDAGLVAVPVGAEPALAVSAHTGAGIDALRQHLKACVGYSGVGEGGFMARRRHVEVLQRVAAYLDTGAGRLAEGAGELLAEDLRQAQTGLGEITGGVTADDLLGRIFSRFCIGK